MFAVWAQRISDKFHSSRQKHEASMPELDKKDFDLLADLLEVGAATPIQLQIRTHRVGQKVRDNLRNLAKHGYIKRIEYEGGQENEVFAPLPIARKIISKNSTRK